AAGQKRPAKEGERAPAADSRGIAALAGQQGGSVVKTRAGKTRAREANPRALVTPRRLTHATDVGAADARALLRARDRVRPGLRAQRARRDRAGDAWSTGVGRAVGRPGSTRAAS